MSALLVHPHSPDTDGTILAVTPESAGWSHVGFEVLALDGSREAERECGDREVCVVAVAGPVSVRSDHGEFALPGREDPWSGPPDAVYLPPRSRFTLTGAGEVALCWAPAPGGGAEARMLPGV